MLLSHRGKVFPSERLKEMDYSFRSVPAAIVSLTNPCVFIQFDQEQAWLSRRSA